MKILDKLKTLGIHGSQLKDLLHINITVNVDKSVRVVGNRVDVNPNKINGKQRRALEQAVRALLAENGAIVDISKAQKVEQVAEVLPEIEQESSKIRVIIPPEDIALLEACLYLRIQFRRGVAVDDLKSQIIRVYGTRGANFANLCSAGYLEDWFLPLYDEIIRANPNDLNLAKTLFYSHYKTIVNELPWTEFVSSRKGDDIIAAHVVDKMKRNVGNGVRYLNIHGLGETNVKKVIRILPSIQTQTGAIIAKSENEVVRVFVRLEIPPK